MAVACFLGLVGLGVMLDPLPWAVGCLGGVVVLALACGVWLRRIDMSL